MIQLLFLFTFYTTDLESAIAEVGYLAITVQQGRTHVVRTCVPEKDEGKKKYNEIKF